MPQEERCSLEARALGSVGHFVRTPEGDIRWDVGGGVEANCGSKWLRADSASYFEKRGVLYLFGNVEYTDEERKLVAERATYYEEGEWVRSEGNVRLTDADGRSTLEGPVLDYFPATEDRPVERIFAPERPHLTFYPEAAGEPEAEPFEVDADRMHIYGDSLIAAAGEVVAVRADLTAAADSMDLDLGRDELWLLGGPSVTANDMRLEGDSIWGLLEEGTIRAMEAWPNGRARGRELELAAPLLRLFLDSGEVVRVVASPGDPERTGAVDSPGRAPWASSESRDYRLVADSVDIQRPGGRLDRVIAVGRAHAQTLEPIVPGDSLLGSDWLEGDTIVGHFSTREAAEEAEEGAELTRLVAVGGARALYHLREDREDGSGRGTNHPAVNYVIGKIITLWLEAGEVRDARVVGPARGLYLEPRQGPQKVDTAAVATDSVAGGVARDTTPGSPAGRGSAR